jgi:hypothetical protein
MSGSGAVQEHKISKYRFWRNYTLSLHGTVKTQSQQFHDPCEASSAAEFEFSFHGHRLPSPSRRTRYGDAFTKPQCAAVVGFVAHARFLGGQFFCAYNSFRPTIKKGRRATDRTRLSYDRFSENGAAASTLNSRLRQPIAPIVLPKGFNTYRWWAMISAALDA